MRLLKLSDFQVVDLLKPVSIDELCFDQTDFLPHYYLVVSLLESVSVMSIVVLLFMS